MRGSEFDETSFFAAVDSSGARTLLIGRRAMVVLGLPVLTADYGFWVHFDDIEKLNASWPVEKILEEAFKLDPKDRALVVAELSSSEGIASPEEVEAAWREEIARRVKSLEDGTAVLHDWDEVNEEISSILKGA